MYDFKLLAEPKFRGERVNNPFNIVISQSIWQGKVTPSHDSRFETFSDPVYGVRAGVIVLKNYGKKYGLRTINGVFDRYAPPNENDTAAYKAFVCEHTGLGLDEEFVLKDVALPLSKSIIRMEQSRIIYPDELILEGIHLALE